MRRTKIVCTIGPATSEPAMLEQLIGAGMNVARLNFSHGTHETHGKVIQTIREISDRLKKPVAILQDIAGPKIRVGQIQDGPVEIKTGDAFVITDEDIPGTSERVTVNYKGLPQLVRAGDRLLLSDGALELEVMSTGPHEIQCIVRVGGLLNSHKGVNLPSRSTGIPILTEKDRADLAFGMAQEVDFIALSFVRTAADVNEVRNVLDENDKQIPLIAKIEKPEALDNIDEIIEVVDGIMVARGDLGVELPFEKVPLAQKKLIAKANRAGKPVITATQMLESMVENPRPTRAEVTDVANAILDGTDAVMLSEESAMGKYPINAVQSMHRIAVDVEQGFPYREWTQRLSQETGSTVGESVAQAACRLSECLDIGAIITSTTSGRTAREVARYRPPAPILAPTPSLQTYRQLALVWGVIPLELPVIEHTDQMIREAYKAARKSGILSKDQKAVMTAGVPVSKPGNTNMVLVISEDMIA
ncbi:MAG: pyruvate kinase [Spartobacteria bacterium]|nr:pyruvate kinase [Spartobacteria bacterium]